MQVFSSGIIVAMGIGLVKDLIKYILKRNSHINCSFYKFGQIKATKLS